MQGRLCLNRNIADSVIKREEKTERGKEGGVASRNSGRGKGGGREPVKTTAKNRRPLPILRVHL